ncbi:MAG: SAM-dependent methyltransferase [Pleurocapsa sp.]
MALKLARVVPFGRSLDEYRQMFALTEADLSNKKILGVGDGSASFNVEGTAKGADITSIDPLYQFNGTEIKQQFDAVVDNIIDQVIATPDDWVWSYHQSPQALKASRINTLKTFLSDYQRGKQQNRYLSQELPVLDFSDAQFDLALCSHFLFLYSNFCDRDFHLKSIAEMLRVSNEVRIFPLLTLMSETSPYLDDVITHFQNLGYSVTMTQVSYELQKGGNQMLAISK